MLWTDEARDIIEALLQELPLPLREGVRSAAELRAETLAEPEPRVQQSTAVRAFIEATPEELRERLKHTLTYSGIDPDDFEDAFRGSA